MAVLIGKTNLICFWSVKAGCKMTTRMSSIRNEDLRALVRRTGVAALMAVVLATTAYPDDWPCWRGTNRDGITAESISVWPPQKLWSAYVGEGFSQVAVSEHRVYTIGKSGGTETVYCFSDAPATTNPAPLWTNSYTSTGTGTHSGDGYGSKATPAVDGNYIYTLSCDGILNCINKTSGALLWSATNSVANTYEWGTPGSPLIEGNLVIINCYGHGLAFDKTTGNIAWGTNDINAAGAASPFAVTIGTQRTVVVMGDWWDPNCSRANKDVMRINGVDPATGNVLWWAASDDSMGDSGIADPIICNGIIRYSCTHIKTVYGYNLGSQPSGQLGEAWRANSMENVNTPVLLNGYIYALDLVSAFRLTRPVC